MHAGADVQIAVDAFWARYDWTAPVAAPHTQVARDELKKKWEEQRAEAAKAKEEKAAREKKEREAAKAAKERSKEAEAAPKKESDKEREKSEVKTSESATPSKDDEAAEKKTEEAVEKPDVSTLDAVARGYEQDVEWTKEGVETILATVGVQCAYNTAVSPCLRQSERTMRGR